MLEISAKCVFGLHRRVRIACATFPRMLPKVTPQQWFSGVFLETFSHMVEVASSVCRKGAKMVARVPKGVSKVAGSPLGAQGCSKGDQAVAKGAQGVPKAAQSVPKGVLGKASLCKTHRKTQE